MAQRRPNLLTSLMLVFPLFLVYQVGVLAIPEVYNGADLITSELLHLLHGQIAWYILINVALGLVFLIALTLLRKKNEFHPRMFVPVLAESALYAITMGALIVFVMTRVLHIDPGLRIAAAAATGPKDVGFFGRIILSFGAGVHEELVFRLLMIPGLILFAEKLLAFRRWMAIGFAFLGSALLFSAAHHVVGGEPWRIGVFVYRVLCGLTFASLFQWRGFAVAVYTHALYDVFVLTLHA
jgi:membrane protease YdiL (CAAX protease family)